jgi:hypothetical protein
MIYIFVQNWSKIENNIFDEKLIFDQKLGENCFIHFLGLKILFYIGFVMESYMYIGFV